MAMALEACGVAPEERTQAQVNQVMGATPTKGAAWEQALATAQHYGCRATLTVPATVTQLRAWTDAKIPVMIAWNPEGREWSHASCVFDVTEGLPEAIPATAILQGEGPGLYVWVADSNIPHPEKTIRICHEDVFYSKWYEKWPKYLVRRPAMAVEREITPGGRQVMASAKQADPQRVLARFLDRRAYTMTAKGAAKLVRQIVGIRGEDVAHDLSDSDRSALLEYIVITRQRTPHNDWTKASHAHLSAAQSILLSVKGKRGAQQVAQRWLEKQAKAKKLTGGARRAVMQEVFDMYAKTYAAIGMHLKTPEALLKYDVWEVGFDDGVPIFFSLFETTSFGLKSGSAASMVRRPESRWQWQTCEPSSSGRASTARYPTR